MQLARFSPHVTARTAGLALAGVAAGVGTVLAGAGLLATSGFLISSAALRPPIADLMLVFVAVRFFGIARPALRYAERLASHDATFRMLAAVRRWFIDALLPLSRGQLLSFRAGDLLSRLAGDVDALQESWLRVGAPAAVAIVTCAITFAVLFRVHPALALAVLGLLLFNGVAWSWVARRIDLRLGARRNERRRALTADVVMLLQGLEDVVAFGYEDRALGKLRAQQRSLDEVDRRYGWRLAVHAGVGTAVTYLAFWAALALTLPASGAQIPFVWIAAIALAVVASFEAVEGLPAAWQFSGQASESARRVAEVASTEPAVRESPSPLRLVLAVAPAVQLHGVTFGYARRPVMQNLTLRVAPGEHVALVGPSGSGKSTLLSLVARAWDPWDGEVTIDDLDVRRVRQEDLQQAVAVMPQQIDVFNTTLRDNVRLARPAATDAEVMDALRRAQLAGFVAGLPHGLDTILGEQGARMSAGERRRLGFARILLTDAAVVLVDEPTEHLDAPTAAAVLEELKAWASRRTMLLVTHRPAATRLADRIVQLTPVTD